jgi:hypothetical protein
MKKTDIMEFLKDLEDDADVDEVVKGNEGLAKLFEKGLTIDDVKNFLDSDETGKQYLQSYADSKVTKGIQSWKDNNISKIVDAEILKRNPSKSPQELEIENLKRQFEEEKQLRELSEQKSKLKDELKDKNVDPRIIELLINKDADVTRANVALYLDANKNYVQKEVEKRIKEGQYTPPDSDEKDQKSKLTKDINKAFGL